MTDREHLRNAATTEHGNCAYLEPGKWTKATCPVCEKPTLVPSHVPILSAILGAAVGFLGGLLAWGLGAVQ